MQIGYFNMNEYINKLNESEDGNIPSSNKDGLIIPEENKKAYDWLKGEYKSNQIETKVEIKNGKDKIENKDEFVAKDDTNKDFKPGQFSTDQKNTGDGSKSDFKPFDGKTSDNKPKKDETDEDKDNKTEQSKKKVSIKGITPKTKSSVKKKADNKEEMEDKDKEDDNK